MRARYTAQHVVGVAVKLGVHQTQRGTQGDRIAHGCLGLEFKPEAAGLGGIYHVRLGRVNRI